MPPTYFPLRWETTGDQWWFASPIDFAAANGHYDLVRELLHMDRNHIIKLTSLPRIRRLETVWDDEDPNASDTPKNRAKVAHKLLQECETKRGYNSLIRAGYGGWLMYTAASAGDPAFVGELLERDPLLVFGEGEYGIMDVFYAAARGRNPEVFRMLLECAAAAKGRPEGEVPAVFRWEVANRAVHAAARGGDMVVLRELLEGGNEDVLSYRDTQGSSVLHSASGRGQVEVVKYLISSYDIISAVDYRGNTALNVAAYRGHLPVIEVLTFTSPSLASQTNNNGDTFLHMAVAGSSAPTFRRLDRQIDLMKRIFSGNLVKIEDFINIRNNDGRTALHLAVMDHNIQSDLVDLIMFVHCIDLNIRDAGDNTPLDLLKQRPRSPSSEILIKRMISAGGVCNEDQMVRNAPRVHIGLGGSPGTSFRIPDAEILLYTGNDGHSSYDAMCSEYGYSGEIEAVDSSTDHESKLLRKSGAVMSNAARRLKNILLHNWPSAVKDRSSDTLDNSSIGSYRMCSSLTNSPIALRQRHSSFSSPPTNKRILSLQGNLPSTKRKLSGLGLQHSAQQVLPKSNLGSPCSTFSEPPWSSPMSVGRKKRTLLESFSAGPSSLNQSPYLDRENVKTKRKHGSFNLRLIYERLLVFRWPRARRSRDGLDRRPVIGHNVEKV